MNTSVQPAPKKRHRLRTALLATGGAVATLIVVAVATGGAAPTASAPIPPSPAWTAPPTTWSGTTEPTQAAAPEVKAPVTPAAPEFPPQVAQARGSAQDYLGFKGFSRDGLIAQLSSSYADGYPKDVATQAVDSLGIDWNAQAVKAAQDYLGFQHFSCSGLIQQLDSKYGEQFTKAQATYGAHQTEACK